MLLVAIYATAHASFAITVRIGAFPYVAIAGVMLFLPSRFWEDARTVLNNLRVWDPYVTGLASRTERVAHMVAARLPNVQLNARPLRVAGEAVNDMAITIAVAAVLVLPGIALLAETNLYDRAPSEVEERIDDVATRFGVSQARWTVFAPNPRTTDRYYVFPARTSDGDLIDVYNDRPMTFERPYDQLNRQYFTYRDRFYMNSVRRAGNRGDIPGAFADYLCDRWRDERGIELTHINMYVVNERVTRETIQAHWDRNRQIDLFYTHGCGDHVPEEIELSEFD
jgi:hypothetical protein